MKAHKFIREITSNSKTLGRENSTAVIFGGKEIKTDTISKKIIIPNLDPQADLTADEINCLRGHIDQETAKILYGDNDVYKFVNKSFKEDTIGNQLFYKLENIRLQKQRINDYLGSKRNLEALSEHVIEENKGNKDIPWQIEALAQHEFLNYNSEIHEDIVNKMDPDLKEQFYPIIKKTLAAKSSKDIFNIIKEIDNPPEDNDSDDNSEDDQNKKESDSNNSDDSNESDDSNNSDKPNSSNNSDESNDSNNSDKSENSSNSDESESSEKSNDSNNPDHISELKKDDEDSKPANSKLNVNLNKKAQKTEDPNQKIIDKHITFQGDGSWDFINPINQIQNFRPEKEEIKHLNYNQIIQEFSSEIMAIKTKLPRFVLDQSKSRMERRKLSGRLDQRAFVSAVTKGDPYAFKRHIEAEGLNTAIMLYVDLSGSMNGSKAITARNAVIAFSEALEPLTQRGLKYAVKGFTTNGELKPQTGYIPSGSYIAEEQIAYWTFKDWNESLKSQKKSLCSLSKYIGLNNNDAPSVDHACKELMKQKENRKIMIVLSDGSPECYVQGSKYQELQYALKKVVENYSKEMEIIGIGLQTDTVKDYYPNNIVISQQNKFAQKLLKTIGNILLKKKKY